MTGRAQPPVKRMKTNHLASYRVTPPELAWAEELFKIPHCPACKFREEFE